MRRNILSSENTKEFPQRHTPVCVWVCFCSSSHPQIIDLTFHTKELLETQHATHIHTQHHPFIIPFDTSAKLQRRKRVEACLCVRVFVCVISQPQNSLCLFAASITRINVSSIERRRNSSGCVSCRQRNLVSNVIGKLYFFIPSWGQFILRL